jgi:hypothetical protein
MYVGGWVSDKINHTRTHTERERQKPLCVLGLCSGRKCKIGHLTDGVIIISRWSGFFLFFVVGNVMAIIISFFCLEVR